MGAAPLTCPPDLPLVICLSFYSLFCTVVIAHSSPTTAAVSEIRKPSPFMIGVYSSFWYGGGNRENMGISTRLVTKERRNIPTTNPHIAPVIVNRHGINGLLMITSKTPTTGGLELD